MSRCSICNACATTGSPSLYESDEVITHSVYRKSLGKDVCDRCWEEIQMNKSVYKFERPELYGENPGHLFVSDTVEETDVEEFDDEIPPWEDDVDIDTEEVRENTPALSEV